MSEWEIESRLISIEDKIDKLLTLTNTNTVKQNSVPHNFPLTPEHRPMTPQFYGRMKYSTTNSSPTLPPFPPQTNIPPLSLNSPTSPPSPSNLVRSPVQNLFGKGGTRNNKKRPKMKFTRKRK